MAGRRSSGADGARVSADLADKKAPETHDESEAIHRAQTRTYTLRRPAGQDVGEVGFVHTRRGTVIFTITPTETYYEAVIDGRLHTRRELARRALRGAKIKAAQWLDELLGEEGPDGDGPSSEKRRG